MSVEGAIANEFARLDGMQTFSLGLIDYAIFGGFLAVLALVGFFSGRGEQDNSEDYFLAGRTLPWYVVGGSYIAANISTEHLIGMVGAAYIFGVSAALYDWLNAFTFMFMIFLFVPFLLSSKIVTIPEFLEKRFSPSIRYIFAILTVVSNVVIYLAAVLYTGGIAISVFVGWSIETCIILIALVSGVLAVYGGLSSVAWTGFLTAFVMIGGASVLSIAGLLSASETGNIVEGLKAVIEANRANDGVWQEALARNVENLTSSDSYSRLSVIQPAEHALTPWTGLVFMIVSVSIWYNVLNQFIIQRILGAKDIWHARMGIVLAGYIKLALPFITVLPGLILFTLHPEYLLGTWPEAQQQADKGYMVLVGELLPIGVKGLLLTALFSAIQSTISSVVNSTATVLTFDIYKTLIRPSVGERETVSFGVWSSVTAIVAAVAIALVIARLGGGIFQYVQTLNAFFAPPFAAIFLVGLLWPRANGRGAMIGVVGGFSVALILKVLGEVHVMPDWYYPFANQAAFTWVAAMFLTVVGTYSASAPQNPGKIAEITLAGNGRILKEGLGDKWFTSVPVYAAGFLLLAIGLMVLFSSLIFPSAG